MPCPGVYPSYSHGGRFFGDIEMARGAGAAGCIGICWNKPAAAHLQAADVASNSMKSNSGGRGASAVRRSLTPYPQREDQVPRWE